MKFFARSALGLALAVGILPGCSGSGGDNPSIVSSGPPTAAVDDDQRVAQWDALTAAEVGLLNQANSEPAPAPLPDL
jgi:hypothetical protein